MPRYESPYDPTTMPKNLEHVIYEKKGHVAYVTINRPEVRNALQSALPLGRRRSAERRQSREAADRRDQRPGGRRRALARAAVPAARHGGDRLDRRHAHQGRAAGLGAQSLHGAAAHDRRLSHLVQRSAHRRRVLSPGDRQQGGAAREVDGHVRGDGRDDLRQLAVRRAGRGPPLPVGGGLPALARAPSARSESRPGRCADLAWTDRSPG